MEVKLSTKNIEKVIRSLKSNYVRKTRDCNGCGKRIMKNGWVTLMNGFGGLNYYHPNCKLDG